LWELRELCSDRGKASVADAAALEVEPSHRRHRLRQRVREPRRARVAAVANAERDGLGCARENRGKVLRLLRAAVEEVEHAEERGRIGRRLRGRVGEEVVVRVGVGHRRGCRDGTRPQQLGVTVK